LLAEARGTDRQRIETGDEKFDQRGVATEREERERRKNDVELAQRRRAAADAAGRR
jgi:hypothetical protein